MALQSDASPAAGHYTGDGKTITLDAYYLSDRRAELHLKFAPGTVIENQLFHVRERGSVSFDGCLLKNVAIKVGPRGRVTVQNCALQECYITDERTVYRRASGEIFSREEVYAEIGVPEQSFSNCVLARCAVDSPYMTGMTARQCTLIDCDIEAGIDDGKSTASSFHQCLLQGSKISSADMLIASKDCYFRQCECTDVMSNSVGAYLTKPVLVRLGWERGNPDVLPSVSSGKVQFELFKEAQGTGSRLSHRWSGSVLSVESISAPTGASQALATVLALAEPVVRNVSPAPPRSSGPNGRNMPATGSAPITASVASGAVFKSRITAVNGLLISQLSSGEKAGQVTKMSLTALPALGDAPSTLKFNQTVGSDMEKALNEVSKFAQLRHNGLPAGHAIELGFADKYIDKDGPSAAVACALLLEAAITGKEWDPAFAVTGDMNADGSVQPIGGVQAKVRGATKGGCKIVGVPVKNEKGISDILVLEGPAPLVAIGIFGVSKFEEALALADPKRTDALQKALAELENVRGVLIRMPPGQMMSTLRTPQAQARLQYILQAAPNCYSAKHLLLFSQGRGPRTLSIGGSIEAADGSATGLIKSIESDIETNVKTLKGDEVGTSINKLRNLRPKLDQRVWPYVDNVIAYGEVIRGSILNPVRSGARFADLVGKARRSAGAAKAAFEKLTGDPQVREELGL